MSAVSQILERIPADISWWKEREKETHHDLQAWVDERVRHLPIELRVHFHDGMTSYDTEESAFVEMLRKSVVLVLESTDKMLSALRELAFRYRHTPMMELTHGQAAEPQTFGKRCLAWYKDVSIGREHLQYLLMTNLNYSRLSGAVGNYGGVSPKVEKEALLILGLKPYFGATQILPRELFAPLASCLVHMVLTIDKIATTIRLGARTPRPIYQEPFGKKQTGSSAMPGKKNTISSEQMEGMGRLALGEALSLELNIKTWEGRAIEQSCVERVAWPDIFHMVLHAQKTITKVLSGLQVYPDNMLRDINDTRGTWAAGSAKAFLRVCLSGMGVTTEDAYRMIQLAAFNAFEPSHSDADLRKNPFQTIETADSVMAVLATTDHCFIPISIKDIIEKARLKAMPEKLDISEEKVLEWNRILGEFFGNEINVDAWKKIFSLTDRLKDEKYLFDRVFGG